MSLERTTEYIGPDEFVERLRNHSDCDYLDATARKRATAVIA